MKYMKVKDLEVGDIIKITSLGAGNYSQHLIEQSQKYNAIITYIDNDCDFQELYIGIDFIDNLGNKIRCGGWSHRVREGQIQIIRLAEEK